MAKIYISSTYSDLQQHREEVYRALRKLGHDVVAMEDYTATDQRPLDKCLEDVNCCDVYIGIFAWRYGYIPPEQEQSITELEFRTAEKSRKKCLIFLLHDDAPWKKSLMDRESEKIEKLREELKKNFVVDFFEDLDELVNDITIAVANALKAEEKDETKDEKPRTLVTGGDGGAEMNQILRILKPIIIVFLSILALSILSMVVCIASPSIRNSEALALALYGLGGLSAFLICCLMFIFNKFLQLARSDNRKTA